MVSGGITQIKNAISSGKFPHIYLIRGTDHKARVIIPNRDEKDFKAKAREIIDALQSDYLPAGNYTVVFKSKYASPKPAAEYSIFVTDGHSQEPMAEAIQPETMERSEEMQLREELVRLRLENENLKKELEAEQLEEAPDPAATITTVAETVKSLLSEVVVPIVSKYMEQRERKVQALEAAAATAARPPVYTAPSQSFQIRPGYTATARPAAAPSYAAPPAGTPSGSSGAPGSGGQQPPPEPEMTESEYIEAVKHLTFDELQAQYNIIKNSGKKVDLAYFLAVVREARPDDLVPLIDQDLNKPTDE